MIVAGEMSGDLHGASLVHEIKQLAPNTHFFGMGGDSMAKEGVRLLYDAAKLAVVGLFEVLSHLKDIKKARTLLLKEMQSLHPDLLILIDFPDFNLSLAKKAKASGIPVFYYISPQVWAWRSGRVKKIAALVDQMVVILPFEKDFYRQKGMEVSFVGHPLLDEIKVTMSPEEFRKKHNIPTEKKIIAILPGSRKKEIKAILPTFLLAARKLYKKKKNIVFILPLAPSLDISVLQGSGLSLAGLPVQIIHEDRYDLMAHSALAMAASGTVTLELAILKTPMVVAYQISALTYFIGRRLIKVKYASLVNLIGAGEIVRELIQDDFTPENITEAILAMWPGTSTNQIIMQKLQEVTDQLGGEGASRRTAKLALATIKQRNN